MKTLFTLLVTMLCILQNSVWANESAQKAVESMTLEEKVGQLFFVRPEALKGHNDLATLRKYDKGVTRFSRDMEKGIRRYPVGGVVLFAKNIANPEQTKKLIADLKRASTRPLIIAVDEEGGRVARVANNPRMQVINVGEMGKVDSERRAYLAGHRIGKYLNEYGFDMDFAPVADVLTNPANTLVKGRSFGSDAMACGNYAKAYIDGLHDFGIMSTVKHFPGHGGWEKDSHISLSESLADLEALRRQEFVAFRKALGGNTEAVMIAHMVFPKITKDRIPASLNRYFITDLLRKELGFQGLIITDSLAMDAVAKYFGHEEAAVKAINAGADILLMPGDLSRAYKGVLEAVRKGIIAEARINAAVEKQLCYKQLIK